MAQLSIFDSTPAKTEREPPEAVRNATIVPLVWLTCGLAAVAGLLFGMDIGVITGALPFLQETFNLSSAMEGVIVSSMMVGAAVGVLAASSVSLRFGRKKPLLLSSLLFFFGAVVCVVATDITVLICGRFILGLAVGISSLITPMYLSEVTPERIRGTTISFFQLMLTVGVFAAFVSNLALSYADRWRWMFGVLIIPSILLFVCVLMVPESPRWLAARQRFDRALDVLGRLRSTVTEVDYEMREIEEAIAAEDQSRGWRMFRANSNFRRSVMLGVGLQIVQQFTGINVVMYFAPQIFQMAGFEGTVAHLWATLVTGLMLVLATFIAIGFVDKLGRKSLLYIGFSVMAVSMMLLGTILHVGPSSTWLSYSAMAVLLIFVAGYAMSAGPVIWTLCSEIQPLHGRDFGIGASTFCNWVGNAAIGQFFPILLVVIGGPPTFWLLGAFNALFIVFTLMLVPETKGMSLEKIQKNLLAGKPLRRIGV